MEPWMKQANQMKKHHTEDCLDANDDTSPLKGRMTRQQVVDQLGQAAVERVDNEACEPTSRCMPSGCDLMEWSASIRGVDADNNPYTLIAYYYTTPQDAKDVEANGGDWGAVNWEISGYEII